MRGSMADIQSATAEIRRGKKKERTKEKTAGQKYNGLPYSTGRHKYCTRSTHRMHLQNDLKNTNKTVKYTGNILATKK